MDAKQIEFIRSTLFIISFISSWANLFSSSIRVFQMKDYNIHDAIYIRLVLSAIAWALLAIAIK